MSSSDVGVGNTYGYGARFYGPSVGRFTGVDPISDQLPWVSTYNYTENEPVASIDLWGLQRVKVNGNYLRKQRNAIQRKTAERSQLLSAPSRISGIGRFKSGSTNITSVSARIARHMAENGNMTTAEGSEWNAVRHVVWSAMMTQEFGDVAADAMDKAHEGINHRADVEFAMDEPFEGTFLGADATVDLLNNAIGREIGEANADASTLQLGEAVLNEFLENGFLRPR